MPCSPTNIKWRLILGHHLRIEIEALRYDGEKDVLGEAVSFEVATMIPASSMLTALIPS